MGNIFCFEGINNRIWELPRLFPKLLMKEMEECCNQAEKKLGVNIFQKIFSGKTGNPLEDAYTELAGTYLCDYVIYNSYTEQKIWPELMLGFSLGLNTAMTCGGWISFESGLDILKINYRCMEHLYQQGKYGMTFVAGIPLQVAEQVIRTMGLEGKVRIASETSEHSLLLTGELESMERMHIPLKEEGAMKINQMNTYIPFHYGYHDDFIDEEMKKIQKIPIKDGKHSVYSVYSLHIISKEMIRDELKKNIYTPMQWRRAIDKLEQAGYREFWDVSLTAGDKKITCLSQKDSIFHTFKEFKKAKVKYIDE